MVLGLPGPFDGFLVGYTGFIVEDLELNGMATSGNALHDGVICR